MAKITTKQMQALRDYAEGREHPDYDDFTSAGSLAFHNRDRVIAALQRRGLIDAEQQITGAGRDMVAGRHPTAKAPEGIGMRKLTAALLVGALSTIAIATSADAAPKRERTSENVFATGGPVNCDDRYPWTCDVRGWRSTVDRARPFREGRPARRSRSLSLDGVTSPLADKVAAIVSACGSRVISTVRHTYTPHGRLSEHASGRAVDVKGNPSCIYSMLRGWTGQGGGYSTDYGRVQHVHISYGGREAGRTFAHIRNAKRTRSARR